MGDGMSSTADVILLASTNRADVLDKALLRPGRFDRHITIDLPTLIERKEILEKHLESVVLEKSGSTYSDRLAQLTPGFSGADLANLVNEAALHAAALGFAQYTPQDKKLFSPEELSDRMCMALGGRVAEALTFNKITTGAQNDLERVTKMAYSQIREFGFSDKADLVSFDLSGGGKKPYSKKLAATIDLEARKMIGESYRRTEQILFDNVDKLELLAQKLLEVETLNYADVVALIGPPPHGEKTLISPIEYEQSLKQQSELGEQGQGMGGGT